jgi:predicted Zn-dependent protease
MTRLRLAALVLPALLAVGGCATPGDGAEKEEEITSRGTISEDDGTIRHSVPNRTVALLWERAEQAREQGRVEDAIASLERALRLTPDDPVLWSRVAELRLRQGRFAVAENLAAKSNALAGEQRLLRYRNWLLIAEARKRRGDTEGADKARAEAQRYNGT